MLKVMPTNNINFRLFGVLLSAHCSTETAVSSCQLKVSYRIANYRLNYLFHILAEQYHAIDYTRFVFEAITFIGAIAYLVLAITNIAETGRRRFIDMLKVRE